MRTELYYEAHITVAAPRDEVEAIILETLAEACGFRMSKFALIKEGDQPNAFVSARHQDYQTIRSSVSLMVKELQERGYEVLRYKVEDTLLDSNHQNDPLALGVSRPAPRLADSTPPA